MQIPTLPYVLIGGFAIVEFIYVERGFILSYLMGSNGKRRYRPIFLRQRKITGPCIISFVYFHFLIKTSIKLRWIAHSKWKVSVMIYKNFVVFRIRTSEQIKSVKNFFINYTKFCVQFKQTFPIEPILCSSYLINTFVGKVSPLNTLMPRQNGRHFADDISSA